MDRELPDDIKARRKRKLVLFIVIPLLILLFAGWLLRGAIKPSLKRSGIRTAVIEKGDVENTLTASGVVLPEFEETITSPIAASIQKVMVDAGSKVTAGKSILTLDKSAAQAEYEKMKFQLESKRNSILKLKIELDKSFFDLKSNNDIKQLRINSLQASSENMKRLFKAGGCTREDVEQAELSLKVALLEKKQLENELLSKQQSMQTDMKESQIAAEIQQNDLNELQRKLRLADILSTRPGVVTWINKNIGTNIREGEALARIADLGSFKISGSISDSYIDQVKNGVGVVIRINETQIRGRITNIHPAVQNGIVTFDADLEEKSNPLLRPEMKVDLFLITAVHNGIFRVANGPAFKGQGRQDVFVLDKSKAVKRTVHIGLSNFDFVEITDNVKPGDVVIISDMSDYKNTAEVDIKN